MAANGSTLQNGTGGNQQESAIELPPPYSAVPQYRVENPQVIHNPTVPQQNNTWYPQGMNSSHPPFSYPGGNQPSPGYFTYNPTAAPSRPGVQLSEEESRRRQEAAIRHGIAASVVRRPFGGRRSCTYRLIRLGIALFILGVTLLVVFGVLFVRPAVNDTQLKSARCKVISSFKTGVDMSCDCGRYCSSKYPCLEIQVSYDADGKENTAYLYKNVFADKNQCSAQPCDSVESFNEEDVNTFKSKYGRHDDEYRCYYNPKTPDEAFANRSGAKSDKVMILNCILWPMLLIGISVGLLGTLFLRSKGICCKRRDGTSVPYQDLQPRA